MNTFVALLRGINVGGKNILPMQALTEVLEDLGSRNVRTYIQSGNVVFQSEKRDVKKLSRDIRSGIDKNHGFKPETLVLSLEELRAAVAANPFSRAERDPKTLHLFFLQSAPGRPDLDRLEGLKAAREQFRLLDRVFYLHAPEGIGRSKLAPKVETALGCAATARNWRTVNKTLSMAEELGMPT